MCGITGEDKTGDLLTRQPADTATAENLGPAQVGEHLTEKLCEAAAHIKQQLQRTGLHC